MNKKPTLLCIDDDERILRSLKTLFRETHNVLTTTKPEEFKEILSSNDIQVIISDQRMPVKTGTELLAEAKEISPQSVRILLTGYADIDAVIDAINKGEIYQYIQKPWDIEHIRGVVSQATKIALGEVDDSIREELNSLSPPNKNQIIYIDSNDDDTLHFFHQYQNNYNITCVNEIDTAYDIAKQDEFAVAIINLNLNEAEDINNIIKELKTIQPLLITIVLTCGRGSNTLIDLMNSQQIFRCCEHPIESEQFAKVLTEAIEKYESLQNEPELQLRYLLESSELLNKVINS